MVQRVEIAFLVALEHWEVDNPQRCPAWFDLTQVGSHFQTQRANCLINNTGFVCAKENDVATGHLQTVQHLLYHIFRHEFDDW